MPGWGQSGGRLRGRPLDARGGLLAALFGSYGAFAYATAGRRTMPRLCPAHRLFGRSCPLCGLTRALGAALRGDRQALRGVRPSSLVLAGTTLYLYTGASARLAAGSPLTPTRKGVGWRQASRPSR